MATRIKKFLWLPANTLQTFQVKAQGVGVQSDWSDPLTMRLSDAIDAKWVGGRIVAKPLYWQRAIRCVWTPMPVKYRKEFQHYILFRNNATDNGDITPAQIVQSAQDLEASSYFLATTLDRRNRFNEYRVPEGWYCYYIDFDILEEKKYEYWVYIVKRDGTASTTYLGPDNAEYGSPEIPQFRLGSFTTQVHEINKWWCDVNAVWRCPGGAEYYLIQRRQVGKALWGFPTRVDHDPSIPDEWQNATLQNFIVNRDYEFRIRSVNVPGKFVSKWNDDAIDGYPIAQRTYHTVPDTDPPDFIENVSARRQYFRDILTPKGDNIIVKWDRPTLAFIEQQIRYYNVYRIAGSDTDADDYRDLINLHDGSAVPYEQAEKFLGTHFIDDKVEELVPTYPRLYWTGDYNGGGDDTSRRTAESNNSTIVGTLNGTAAINTNNPYQGNYSLEILAAGDYLRFNNTNDIIRSAKGYISFWVNTNGFLPPNKEDFFKATFDANNYIEIFYQVGRTYINFVSGGTSVQALTIWPGGATFTQVEATWDVSLNQVQVRINGGAWGSNTGTMNAFPSEPVTVDIGSPVNFIATYHIDLFEIWDSLGDSISGAGKYHYWITAVDEYGYESDVDTSGDDESHDSVSFSAPDAPTFPDDPVTENLLQKGPFAPTKYSTKIQWNRVDEATHYRMSVSIKPAEKLWGGGDPTFSIPLYSPLIDQAKSDEEYVHSFGLQKGAKIRFGVQAVNRAGKSAFSYYDENIAGEGYQIKAIDEEDPNKIEFFGGDCSGVFKLVPPNKLWLGVSFWWQPRPNYEGVNEYVVSVYDPVADRWREIFTAPHRRFPDSSIIPITRQRWFYLCGPNFPTNCQYRDSNQFRILGMDGTGRLSEWSYVTVNWERWWVF